MADGKEVKGKYGALIQKAREQENQISGQPEDQKVGEPEKQGEAQARELESQGKSQAGDQLTRQPEDQKASEPENKKEREVNLCVKVPVSLRRHWAAEAKRQGITMTEVMVEALVQRFGKPEDQITR